MDQQIKFKAWHRIEKVMYPPFSLFQLKKIASSGSIGGVDAMGLDLLFSFPNLLFLQYTNLKDKIGIEIYKGDIVKFIHNGQLCTAEIYWNNLGMWCLKWPNGYINNYYLYPENLEVIGNIYKNPELLAPQPHKITNNKP